jgi:hypothetical protein
MNADNDLWLAQPTLLDSFILGDFCVLARDTSLLLRAIAVI